MQALITRSRNNGRFWPGRSTCYPPGSVPCTFRDLARDAAGVLDAVGVETAHVVGRSWGGGMVDVPTLVVHGDHDALIPLPHGEALRDTIRGVELPVLPGAGHDLARPVWNTFVAALLGHTS